MKKIREIVVLQSERNGLKTLREIFIHIRTKYLANYPISAEEGVKNKIRQLALTDFYWL